METMHKDQHGKQGHYGRLLLMTALSFVAMFILMYAMVDRFAIHDKPDAVDQLMAH